MTQERAKSFEEAEPFQEFEQDGYVWLKLKDGNAALVMDENGEIETVRYSEH